MGYLGYSLQVLATHRKITVSFHPSAKKKNKKIKK
jgi:hypothetical protein